MQYNNSPGLQQTPRSVGGKNYRLVASPTKQVATCRAKYYTPTRRLVMVAREGGVEKLVGLGVLLRIGDGSCARVLPSAKRPFFVSFFFFFVRLLPPRASPLLPRGFRRVFGSSSTRTNRPSGPTNISRIRGVRRSILGECLTRFIFVEHLQIRLKFKSYQDVLYKLVCFVTEEIIIFFGYIIANTMRRDISNCITRRF